MRYIIVSNGSIIDYSFYNNVISSDDFIICADGGAKHLIKMNIVPNVIIGDLDSIDEEHKKKFLEKKVEFQKFPTNKDATDTELALDFALSHNPSEIILIGTLGSRMDHSIANVTLLRKILDKNIKGKMINENNEIYIIDDKHNKLVLSGENNEYLSLIPLSNKVKGVTLEGFKYPLFNAEISFGSSIGVSNEFAKKQGSISINEGLLLVIKARD
ncbi:thiamine diphosphokinase [Wukongibacter baidiensis]|uniref:thiamine diphosphokinase n=1 Tax=Wukongibacter baidiensis TaxID=1723361 RepID=UPI003D7FFC25